MMQDEKYRSKIIEMTTPAIPEINLFRSRLLAAQAAMTAVPGLAGPIVTDESHYIAGRRPGWLPGTAGGVKTSMSKRARRRARGRRKE